MSSNQILSKSDADVAEFEKFAVENLNIDGYTQLVKEHIENFSDNSFDNYCLIRDILFTQLKRQEFEFDKGDLTSLFSCLDDLGKVGLVDSGYVDNFKQSFKNHFHEAISEDDILKSQEIIDKHIKPSKQLSGWKFYDRFLSGYLIYLFHHADKDFELRKLYHLSYSIFKQSESTVKKSFEELKVVSWGEYKNLGMAYFLLSFMYARISMMNFNILDLKARAVNHKRSEDIKNAEINAYYTMKKAVAHSAVQILKEDCHKKSPFLRLLFSEKGCASLLDEYGEKEFSYSMPHMKEADLSALSFAVFIKYTMPEFFYSEKIIKKIQKLIWSNIV